MQVTRNYEYLKIGAAVGSQAFWKSGGTTNGTMSSGASITAITLPSLSSWTLSKISIDALMGGSGSVTAYVSFHRSSSASAQLSISFKNTGAWQTINNTTSSTLSAIKTTGIFGGWCSCYYNTDNSTGWSIKQITFQYTHSNTTVTQYDKILYTDATNAGISVSQYDKILASDTGFTSGNIIKASDWNSKTLTQTIQTNYNG